MSKELTPLEALERLKKNNAIGVYDNDDKEELDIIEKALKALEIIKPYIRVERYEHMDANYLIIEEETQLISKEIYNLLKEVLL